MGEEQRPALARLFAEDEAFKAELTAANVQDSTSSRSADLSHADLDRVSGGVFNDMFRADS